MASLVRRGKVYYVHYYVNGRKNRVSLQTESFQIAKEKVRQIESSLAQGEDCPLPSRTPLPQVVSAYVRHIRTIKTAKSAQTDVYYLRQIFGAICPELEITSRKISPKNMKRPPKPGIDRRLRAKTIEVQCIEQITTADIADFISNSVRSRGLSPRTANRYREIIHRLINWASQQGRVKMPAGINPAGKVERYQEKAPEIRFLTLTQIDEQLQVLTGYTQLQADNGCHVHLRRVWDQGKARDPP